MAGGRHVLRAAPVHHGDLLGAELARLHGGVDRGHAAADHQHAAADRHGGVIGRLAQLGDELDRVAHALQHRLGDADGVHTGQAQAQEHRVVVGGQRLQADVAPDMGVVPDLDATDGQQPGDLLLCEVIDRLVGGQAVLVEPAGLGIGIEHDDIVALARQAVGAGEAGRTCTHHGHALAGGFCAGEQRRARVGEMGIGGEALQLADLDRLVFVGVAHAGLFAQHLGRADAGAHAAQRVGAEDGVCGATQVAVGDALDEARHIDARGAGRLAGRLIAVVATVRLDARLGQRKGRVGVAKVVGVLRGAQAGRPDVAQGRGAGSRRSHGGAFAGIGEEETYQLVNINKIEAQAHPVINWGLPRRQLARLAPSAPPNRG